MDIILTIGKTEYEIIPNKKDDFLTSVPSGAEILGVIPEDIRVLRNVEMFVLRMCQRKAKMLRMDFLEKKILKEDLLKEIDSLKELIQFRKIVTRAFKIEVALHFAKGFSIPFDRLHFCNGWRAAIFPTF